MTDFDDEIAKLEAQLAELHLAKSLRTHLQAYNERHSEVNIDLRGFTGDVSAISAIVKEALKALVPVIAEDAVSRVMRKMSRTAL